MASLHSPVKHVFSTLQWVFKEFTLYVVNKLYSLKTWETKKTGNTNLLVEGSITVQSTSCQAGFKLGVVDVNKYFLYNQAKLAYQEVDST